MEKEKNLGLFFFLAKCFQSMPKKRKIFPKKIREGPVTFFRKNGAVTITRKFRPVILESNLSFSLQSRRLDDVLLLFFASSELSLAHWLPAQRVVGSMSGIG